MSDDVYFVLRGERMRELMHVHVNGGMRWLFLAAVAETVAVSGLCGGRRALGRARCIAQSWIGGMFGDGRICVVWVGQVMSRHLRTRCAVLDKSKHGRGQAVSKFVLRRKPSYSPLHTF